MVSRLGWHSGQPRVLVGDETYGYAFFDLLDGRQHLAFGGDVTPGIVREKVSRITLIGRMWAPKDVVPVLQVLATEKYGTISAAGDGDG